MEMLGSEKDPSPRHHINEDKHPKCESGDPARKIYKIYTKNLRVSENIGDMV
jgi:hypothetical protein